MQKLKIFGAALLLFALVASPAMGQDLMANQAPVDRQLRATDSVTLIRVIEKVQHKMISPLYTTWINHNVDCYGGQKKPRTFKVDLRGFTMPIPSRVVTSNYGYRRRFRRNHKGLDIDLHTGDTVVSAFEGKVRIVDYDRRGFGYYVVVRHPNGLETVYGHLSKQLVVANQMVKSGEPIGLGGNTGHSFGSHLHFETRILGDPINPALLFDFANQDVTNDFYVYHNANGYDTDALLAANERINNGEEVAIAENAPSTTAPAIPAAQPKRATASASSYHKVRKGDTLSSIARSAGNSVAQLTRLNGISTKTTLRIGQILKCK